MNAATLEALASKSYDAWHGEGSWDNTTAWRRQDWKRLTREIIEDYIIGARKPSGGGILLLVT